MKISIISLSLVIEEALFPFPLPFTPTKLQIRKSIRYTGGPLCCVRQKISRNREQCHCVGTVGTIVRNERNEKYEKKNRCETWKALNIRIVGDTFYVISIICANYECTHTHVRNGIDLRVYWKHVMYVRSERRTPGAKLSHIYSIYTEWPGITSIKKVDMKKNGERKNGQPFLYKIHNIFSFSIISFLVPFLNCIYNFFSIGKHSLFLFCTYTVMYINIKMHTHVLIDQWFLVMLLLLLSLHIGCVHAAGWKKNT